MDTTARQTDIDRLLKQHPEAFRPPFWKRYALLIALFFCALYTIYCWWFFSVGQVMQRGNWDIAGGYLADWISYEIRPDVEYDGDYLAITYPRFSPLGDNPSPTWMVAKRETVVRTRSAETDVATTTAPGASSASSFMQPEASGTQSSAGSFMQPAPSSDQAATGPDPDTPPTPAADPAESEPVEEDVILSVEADLGAAQIDIVPRLVTVTYGSSTLTFDVIPDESVIPREPLPYWAYQREDGGKVILDFGWSGRAEIQTDEVQIRRRFLGWENFFFDTNSKFYTLSAGERLSTIVSGDRLDPDRSNLALAWSDFLNNPSWQHYDVWLKLLQTIVMAFVGTVFATLVAFPLSFLAARNITPNRLLNQFLKRAFDFLRSVDMLIWALFFTRAFGPGPLAGISAIFFTDSGTLGKLYAEALENIDDKQREGVRSVGASPALVQRFGVLPQVLPVFLSQSLYFWESNTRSATIIGAVGAGGIGLKLWEAMRTNQDWENVAYMVLLILFVVFLFDTISNALRSKLIDETRP